MKKLVKSIAFILIILTYCLYSGLVIYRTSFVIDGERYFSLFDDAMISMRYAKNLANGYGLVWNPNGERVEGYTNFLWVIYMSIFHLLPIAQSKISLFIQISGALFLIINLFFVKKMADLISNNSTFVSLSAVLLTAFYLPLNSWSLQGMEVSALTLIISISVWKALQCIKSNKFSIWLYVLLGVGTLVRIDFIISFIAILIFIIIYDPKNRGKNLLWGLLIFVAFVLSMTLFRIWYYGDILPNAYYLKLTGYPLLFRITRGLYVFLQFVGYMGWILFLIPLSILIYQRDKHILLLFWIFLVQIMYSIYVGGDAWEWSRGSNRFISIGMPIFFILFCYSLEKIKYTIYKINKTKQKNNQIAEYIFVAVVFISLISFNIAYSTGTLKGWLKDMELYALEYKNHVELGLLLKKITTHQAKIAVTYAGTSPYFSDRYAIDILGKNDKKIAHESMHLPSEDIYTSFYPGHMKWNYSYSIGQLKPDIVVHALGEDAKQHLDRDYKEVYVQGFGLYLLNESNNILWDKIKV